MRDSAFYEHPDTRGLRKYHMDRGGLIAACSARMHLTAESARPPVLVVPGLRCKRGGCVEHWTAWTLDLATATELTKAGLEHRDPACLAVQTEGLMLCDCGALTAEWDRLQLWQDLRGSAA